MWPYDEITREEFELVKDKVEAIIIRLGGIACDISLPYVAQTISVYEGNEVVCPSNRPVYKYKNEYYRVSEVCFERPAIVIEYGDYEELIHNRMEDAEPFPYCLDDNSLEQEVKYSLGILPYPE